jgi:hypothetical protein
MSNRTELERTTRRTEDKDGYVRQRRAGSAMRGPLTARAAVEARDHVLRVCIRRPPRVRSTHRTSYTGGSSRAFWRPGFSSEVDVVGTGDMSEERRQAGTRWGGK